MTDRSPDAREDFCSEMWLPVHGGSFLFEVPNGTRDLLPDVPLVHSPWIPIDCSAALPTWFDHGWVRLLVPFEQLFRWSDEARQTLAPVPSDMSWHVLERITARNILAEPGVWAQSRAEGFLCLGTTEMAPSADFRDLGLDVLNSAM